MRLRYCVGALRAWMRQVCVYRRMRLWHCVAMLHAWMRRESVELCLHRRSSEVVCALFFYLAIVMPDKSEIIVNAIVCFITISRNVLQRDNIVAQDVGFYKDCEIRKSNGPITHAFL